MTELALGVRDRGGSSGAVAEVPGSARLALEAVVARALTSGPTFVSFSGGRDSSAVLATAVHVARERNLPLPRPIILRYPGDRDSDETEWQELVLGHLGIDDPIVLELDTPPTYLDADTQANLRRRGLLFPPALQLKDHIRPLASGGMLLTGEGGDEILGPHRITPLTLLVKYRRRPSRTLLSWTLEEVAPGRTRRAARATIARSPWLTEKARAMLRHDLRSAAKTPLHWGEQTKSMVTGRITHDLTHNLQLLADEHDVTYVHPLQSPEFTSALAREGGRWGYAGRTDLMRHLFADLLPDELLARSTKAHFGSVRWGAQERRFAETWDGDGLSTELFDVERLRAEWLSERPAGASALPLHAAWLHSQGLPWEGASHA